jgi:FAD binding domain
MPPAFHPSSRVLSAGRSQRLHHQVAAAATVEDCRWLLSAAPANLKLLPFGAGQSLGDSCLNGGGGLIVTRGMMQVLRFDRSAGLITTEPGLTVGQLADLALAAPEGRRWFPGVFPGSTAVTIAGAIANDVHGKNHESQGSFCHHVQALMLLRSDGTMVPCSEHENADLFRATLGGLGLTGIIVSATIKLQTAPGPLLENEDLRCTSLADALPLFAESAKDWEYRFYWFDPFDPAGRGIFTRSRHCTDLTRKAEPRSRLMRTIARLPLPAAIGRPALWRAWYRFLLSGTPRTQLRCMHYRDSLAPLGEFPRWNRLLGPRGLLHLQSVFPERKALALLQTMLEDCRISGELPCLASIKLFGARWRAGLLSFPREGLTVALDFANAGEITRRLLRRLEARVVEAGGAIYPAKDSTLSPDGFRRSFPEWEDFARHVDPRFSSSFWRRVRETSSSRSAGPPRACPSLSSAEVGEY